MFEINDQPFLETVDRLQIPNSNIYLAGGAVVDFYHSEKAHDYDLNITGVEFNQLRKLVSESFKVTGVSEQEWKVSFRSNNKTYDLFILTPNAYDTNREVKARKYDYIHFLESQMSVESYVHHCLDFDLSIYTAGNVLVEVSSKDFPVHYNSKQNLYDIKHKVVRFPNSHVLRFTPDAIFRFIKLCCIGFKPEKRSYKNMITEHGLEYFLWSDKYDDRDLHSMVVDKFLSTLYRIDLERKIGSESDLNLFVDLVSKSGIMKLLFDIQTPSVEETLNTKGDVMKHLFHDRNDVVEKYLRKQFLFKHYYEQI